MKLYSIIILIFLIACKHVTAQQVNLDVVYNNTTDINASSETINKIKSAVKTMELKTALNSNGNITDKNLVIRVAFFDQGVIGQLILKAEHELTPEKYIEQWQKTVSNKSGVLFLFLKGKGDSQYTLHKMVASQQLEKEHLFPLVTEFINENLSGDFNAIISNGTKYLANAITPVWDKDGEKITQALALIDNNPKYRPSHINRFHNWFGFAFFDLKPATADETKNMKLVNCMTEKDNGDWFFSNKYIYTSSNNLTGYSTIQFYDWDITFEDDDVKGIYIFYDQFLYNILNTIEESGKHNSTIIASEWNWKYKSKYSRTLSDFTGFLDKIESNRLILYFDESYKNKEGQKISILCQSYGNTWCNVFACDLANEVLFGKNAFGDIHNGPWGSHGFAHQIHDKINSSNQFRLLEFDDAWRYTNAGYVVYLTAYNWRYYEGRAEKNEFSGHIATCYPTPGYKVGDPTTGKVIQAGENIRDLYFRKEVWKSSSYDNNIKANLYLEYILK